MKPNKIKDFFDGLFRNVWFGIKTSFLASRFYFSMKLLILLSTTAIPLVNIWLWKDVLNGIVAKETQPVLICLGIYLGLKLVTYLLAQFNNDFLCPAGDVVVGDLLRVGKTAESFRFFKAGQENVG